MRVLIKGALIGGLIAFIWMNISWMVLPWHFMTISTLEDEAPLAKSLKNNVPENGLYILPWTTDKSKEGMEAFNKKMEVGPYAYMVVHPNGFSQSMPKMMFFGLLFNVLVAFMLTYLVSKASGLTYFQKVRFIKLAGLAGALIIVVPNLIWWQFPLAYSLVTLIDAGITWGLAGLEILKIVKS